VNDELELLRAFRAQDATVDAASAHAARTRLLQHITESGNASGPGRWRAYRRAIRVTPGLMATGLAIGLIILVGAVFLGLHGQPTHRHTPATRHGHGKGPLVLHNLAPAKPPRLAGQVFCNADLAPPGAVPGLGGARSGVILVNSTTVHGVNESPFSITARGLAPSTRPREYAVWIIQVSGLGSEAVPLAGAKPRLLGVITPGVGKDGRLAVTGLVPSDISGTYLVRITRQAHPSATKPGRTVLQGVGPL
jgi:hypothetical protein